jgi:hypothetical protein
LAGNRTSGLRTSCSGCNSAAILRMMKRMPRTGDWGGAWGRGAVCCRHG